MLFLSLPEIKKQLNLDPDFEEDDDFLIYLGEVAQDAVERHIDRKLCDVCRKVTSIEEITGEDGETEEVVTETVILPPPLKHGMLLLVGDFYANRESQAYTNITELPLSFKYLMSLYQKYSF